MIRNPIQILGFELFPPFHSWVHVPSYKFADNTRHDTFNDLSQDIVLAGILSRSAKRTQQRPQHHYLLQPFMQSPPGEELRGLVVVVLGAGGGLRTMAHVFKVFVGQFTPFGKSGRMSLKMSRSHTDCSVQVWDSMCPLGANRREGRVIKYLNLKQGSRAGIGKLWLASQI